MGFTENVETCIDITFGAGKRQGVRQESSRMVPWGGLGRPQRVPGGHGRGSGLSGKSQDGSRGGSGGIRTFPGKPQESQGASRGASPRTMPGEVRRVLWSPQDCPRRSRWSHRDGSREVPGARGIQWGFPRRPRVPDDLTVFAFHTP